MRHGMTHPKQPERIYEDVCVAASVCVCVCVCGKSIFMDYERINLSWKNIVSPAPARLSHWARNDDGIFVFF